MSAARILVVDDEADIRSLLDEILTEEGYSVQVAADAVQARTKRSSDALDLVLLDIWMPETDGITLLREWSADENLKPCPVVMMSGHGTVETAVEATRLGAFDFIEKPVSLAKLLRVVERALASDGAQTKPAPGRLVPHLLTPVGKSRAMQMLRESVEKAAGHDTSVMFAGEVGTGREAFARYLHSLSPQVNKPLLSLVAASLSEQDAEQRLLGYVDSNGAAVAGYLEQARGGILYINELADLVPAAQRVLLAALESGSYLPVGGAEPLQTDLRVLSSVSLESLDAKSDALRGDLKSLLGVVTLRVPSLCDYAEDVPELLRYYVDRLVDMESLSFRRFSVAAQNRLRNYPWPGNVRELKNLVHRILIMGGGEEITLEEIEDLLVGDSTIGDPLVKQDLLALPLREAREQFERAYLTQQLILCEGKVGRLAKRVGMERTHLYRKLRSLGIDFRQPVADD
ncbi:MAG: sigma-54-dependent transcriptional regulator [Gammaproteobacteria bacterium]